MKLENLPAFSPYTFSPYGPLGPKGVSGRQKMIDEGCGTDVGRMEEERTTGLKELDIPPGVD